jgi:hypothetical protein
MNQNPKQNFEQATQPNRISHNAIPTQRTHSRADKRRLSPPNRFVQLKIFTRLDHKQKSLTVLTITTQENSVGEHTHISPVFFSQSSVDAQKGKREGKDVQWPNFAAMRQNNRDGRRGRLIAYSFVIFFSFLTIINNDFARSMKRCFKCSLGPVNSFSAFYPAQNTTLASMGKR